MVSSRVNDFIIISPHPEYQLNGNEYQIWIHKPIAQVRNQKIPSR